MKKKLNDSAISPVVGVILMVAITVILATIIGATVLNMGNLVTKNYIVSATAQSISEDIIITYHGGLDHISIEWLNTSINSIRENNQSNPNVGYTYNSQNGTSNKDHVIVVAQFNDGTQQIILDSYV